MKKLLIAAAIVCAAVISQASTVTWSCTKVYNPGTETGVSGAAYVFAGYSASQIITALEGVGVTEAQAWVDGITTKYPVTGTSGTFSHTTKDVDAADLGLSAGGGTQELAILIFDTATITADSNFFVATKSASVPGSGNALFSFGAQGNTSGTGASQLAANWHAVESIPEPTSGLLLLLGMAGLALRRRRA